ncbi:heavy-metal-associated domain-containing protein [Halorarum salinum]|uniref:Heavy-metal-associated domain-containing protein n=1 Tax=Halorarum salinum TaxID=2743089 RepID=A0A7D5QJ91_9EURY|nr:heavy metal-associated domain-containing protein [Halobaculum salinum]QLG63922.1 heavy-metal-associated domain-containing protein [Halobaculum salinum]
MSETITVEGMSCAGCEGTVEDALAEVPGVESASADRTTDSASVEGEADTEALVRAVADAGYDAQA